MEALADVAVEFLELVELPYPLDSFRHHLQVKRLPHAHDGGDQGLASGAVERAHEGAVDLETVDRELAEVTQRRVAGTEVIDRQVDTQSPQATKDLERRLDVLHQDTLGDLQR